MRFKRVKESISAETDMTPMIDMTFQLIAFFMVLLNFGEGEQDARITLPTSELAKPPEAPHVAPLVLQLTDDNMVLFAGDKLPIAALARPLLVKRQVLERSGKKPADATIIIRADADTKAGIVQEVIQKCQAETFERFVLRARQEGRKEP